MSDHQHRRADSDRDRGASATSGLERHVERISLLSEELTDQASGAPPQEAPMPIRVDWFHEAPGLEAELDETDRRQP